MKRPIRKSVNLSSAKNKATKDVRKDWSTGESGLTEHDLCHAKRHHSHASRRDNEVGISACGLDRDQTELMVEPIEPAEREGDGCHAAIVRNIDGVTER